MPRFCPISCDLGSKTLSQRQRDGGSKAWTGAWELNRDEWEKSNNEQKSRSGQRVSLRTPHHKLKRHSNVSMFFFRMAKRDQFPASSHFIYKSVRLLTNFGFSGVCEGKRTISPVVFYPNTLAVDGWDMQNINFTIRGWVTIQHNRNTVCSDLCS